MKLYIWDNPISVSYGTSLLFVAANNLREARRLAKKSVSYAYASNNGEQAVDVSKVRPSRVVNLPYAEYHEWSE